MFTLNNKNKEIRKEKFELMYVQVKDVSKVSKLEKKIFYPYYVLALDPI